MASEAWLVKLEFERVQTYLFAVPELKAMIGANTLVGEILRGRLRGNGFGADADNLPALARVCRAALPDGVSQGVDLHDPDGFSDDAPRESFRRGVLARDGGHFHAVFPNENGARKFVGRASELVGEKLPGLMLSARLVKLEGGAAGWSATEEWDVSSSESRAGAALADLPQFQVCQVTGQGLASGRGRRRDEDRWIAPGVQDRRDAADSFDRGESFDVLGLLRPALVEALGPGTHLFPNLFEDVARSGYLVPCPCCIERLGEIRRAKRIAPSGHGSLP